MPFYIFPKRSSGSGGGSFAYDKIAKLSSIIDPQGFDDTAVPTTVTFTTFEQYDFHTGDPITDFSYSAGTLTYPAGVYYVELYAEYAGDQSRSFFNLNFGGGGVKLGAQTPPDARLLVVNGQPLGAPAVHIHRESFIGRTDAGGDVSLIVDPSGNPQPGNFALSTLTLFVAKIA